MTSSGIDGVDGDSENSLDYQDGDVVLNIEDEELVNDILMNLEILKARGQAEELDNDPSGLAKNGFLAFSEKKALLRVEKFKDFCSVVISFSSRNCIGSGFTELQGRCQVFCP